MPCNGCTTPMATQQARGRRGWHISVETVPRNSGTHLEANLQHRFAWSALSWVIPPFDFTSILHEVSHHYIRLNRLDYPLYKGLRAWSARWRGQRYRRTLSGSSLSSCTWIVFLAAVALPIGHLLNLISHGRSSTLTIPEALTTML